MTQEKLDLERRGNLGCCSTLLMRDVLMLIKTSQDNFITKLAIKLNNEFHWDSIYKPCCYPMFYAGINRMHDKDSLNKIN